MERIPFRWPISLSRTVSETSVHTPVWKVHAPLFSDQPKSGLQSGSKSVYLKCGRRSKGKNGLTVCWIVANGRILGLAISVQVRFSESSLTPHESRREAVVGRISTRAASLSA